MTDLRKHLAELPCGARLLEAARGRDGVHLVGGAVRDLLLGRPPRELDVVVEGPVAALAASLGPGVAHERFGTATVVDGDCRWDLATARAETYAAPGALPDVRAASIDEDLARRDVTVNAIALDLSDGTLRAAEHAHDDLRARRLRVLHAASFEDDPTRLWRVARYRARLGFALDEQTERLAAHAIRAGALDTVSGARLGAELRLALAEPDPVAALRSAQELGIAPWLRPDGARLPAALALLPDDGRRDLVVLAASIDPHAAGDVDALLANLELTAGERAIVRAGRDAPALARAALAARRPSDLARVMRDVPVEAVALAAAHGAGEPARRWLQELRHVRLSISGRDLLDAGVPGGPEVGRRLGVALGRRLDGEIAAGRAAELTAALDA